MSTPTDRDAVTEEASYLGAASAAPSGLFAFKRDLERRRDHSHGSEGAYERTPQLRLVEENGKPVVAPDARLARLAKRVFDIALASVALVVTGPLIMAAAIAIRLDSPGPAFFRQRRMGKDGRSFELLKLRGMYFDAQERFPGLYDYGTLAYETDFHFHAGRDPRITRVGKWIRKLSIDELPNFWNVLKGEMSVVGPRPEIPEMAHLYGTDLLRLLSVKPGITSPAKSTGRDALTFQETLAMDLAYVETPSFTADLRTIARTMLSVVRAANVF